MLSTCPHAALHEPFAGGADGPCDGAGGAAGGGGAAGIQGPADAERDAAGLRGLPRGWAEHPGAGGGLPGQLRHRADGGGGGREPERACRNYGGQPPAERHGDGLPPGRGARQGAEPRAAPGQRGGGGAGGTRIPVPGGVRGLLPGGAGGPQLPGGKAHGGGLRAGRGPEGGIHGGLGGRKKGRKRL